MGMRKLGYELAPHRVIGLGILDGQYGRRKRQLDRPQARTLTTFTSRARVREGSFPRVFPVLLIARLVPFLTTSYTRARGWSKAAPYRRDF
jgi:hypothetical protein